MSVFSILRPTYGARPIGSISSLAATLGVNPIALENYSKQRSELYDRFSISKSDGGTRDIQSPKRELKFIQKRINRAIFDNVIFPDYLFGGVKGRDYVKNASMHSHAFGLMAMDVRNFYPSISESQVKKIYKNLFHFPEDVANILTALTTLDGSVPQGACTSSNIANLVFFDKEHIIVSQLLSKGFVYTRLIDDISISSGRRIFSPKEQSSIAVQIAAMLKMHGMQIKNKKTKITTRRNPEELMEVTGLWLNRGKPRVRRLERVDIRKELRETAQLFDISRTAENYHEKFNRSSGRVAKLAHLGHVEAIGAREKLRKILPHLDTESQYRLSMQIKSLQSSKPGRRSTIEYIERYYKALYMINILKRSNRHRALAMNKVLKSCAPTRQREELIYG